MDNFNIYSDVTEYLHVNYPAYYQALPLVALAAVAAFIIFIMSWFYNKRSARTVSGWSLLVSVGVLALGSIIPVGQDQNVVAVESERVLPGENLNSTIAPETTMGAVNYVKYNGTVPDYALSLARHLEEHHGLHIDTKTAYTILSLENGESLTEPLTSKEGVQFTASINHLGDVTINTAP